MARKRLDPRSWPAIFEPAEEGGFVVQFPDFPEGISQGEDEADALRQAGDLLETMIANYMAEDWDIPEPSAGDGRRQVRLNAEVAAKVAIYRALRSVKIGKPELARRMGVSGGEIAALFDIRQPLSIERIEAVATALGKRLELRLESA